MQCGDCLAGARPAGDLGGPGVGGLAGDRALGRVQEGAPGGERVCQDLLQLVRAGDGGDLARGAFQGRDQVGRVNAWWRGARRQVFADLGPGLLQAHPARQRIEGRVLDLRQHGFERLKVCLRRDEPDDREDGAVDAEPGQVSVAELGEQQLVRSAGDSLERGLDLRESVLVADFEHADDFVDCEPSGLGVLDCLVVRQDREQAVDIADVRGKDDAAPETVDPDGADALILAICQLLQVQPCVGVLAELANRGQDLVLDVPFQPRVVRKEILREVQLSHSGLPAGSVSEYAAGL